MLFFILLCSFFNFWKSHRRKINWLQATEQCADDCFFYEKQKEKVFTFFKVISFAKRFWLTDSFRRRCGNFLGGKFRSEGEEWKFESTKIPFKSSFAISSHPKPTANSTHVFVHYIFMFSFSFNSFFSLNGNTHKKQVNCP